MEERLLMKPILTSELKRFNYLTSEIDAAYHEAALMFHLSDSAMMVLYCLYSNDGCCMLSDICLMSGVSKQTINSALRKLEEEQILYLQATDGKKKMVHLTEKGLQLASQTVACIIEIENNIFNSWTPAETRQYLELTQRYLTTFREKVQEFERERIEPNEDSII